jgi:Flp pilus assembly pilin Flp
MNLRTLIARFRKSESGASMVEYGMALLVIAAIGAAAMTTLGGAVAANVGTACDAFQNDADGAC